MQNEVAGAQIAALTSRSALQRRLKEGYLKMIPIAEPQHCSTDFAGAKSGRHGPTSFQSARREMKWNSRTRCAIVLPRFVLLFSAFFVSLDLSPNDQARPVRGTGR